MLILTAVGCEIVRHKSYSETCLDRLEQTDRGISYYLLGVQ
jgi:hypothetical protein